MILSRRALLVAAASSGVLLATRCAPSTRATLTLGCGERGGSYLQFGELLRDAVDRDGDIRIDARETEGSVENLRLLAAEDVDLALALADSAATATLDRDDVVAIGRVYQNYLQCIVRADAGIDDLAGLAGRRVSLGAPGSGAAATARRVLAAGRMTAGSSAPDAVEVTFRQGVADLEAGRIDALFWSGGIPTPQIEQLAGRLPIRVLDTTGVLPALSARYPGPYAATSIPAGVYGAATAVPTIGIANLLLARAALPAAQARRLVDVLIDDATVLVPPNAVGVQYLTPASLIDTVPVRLHPAAAERFRERYG